MRKPVKEKLSEVLQKAPAGRALEIGAFNDEKSARKQFTAHGLEYLNLDIQESDVPNTVVGDICANNPEDIGIEPNSLSFVYCSDVFEHLQRPWVAAKNISSLLQPGGIAFIFTVWSWRYHPVPIDYWRFSHECLKFLFEDLTCIEAALDDTERRRDIRGFYPDKSDHVEIDELGGWRENWGAYYIGSKPS